MKNHSDKKVIDKLIYIVVFIGPLMNLPQLLKIWIDKTAAGVSVLSWSAFAVGSVLWLIYGIEHKDKPIIYMNTALFFLQVSIAISAGIFQ